MNYITVKDIEEYTSISRKQINNRINKVSHHDNLVMGGGKGRGGKYLIHPLLTNYLSAPNYYSKTNESQKMKKLFNDYRTFNLLNWRSFGCFSPKDCFDYNNLISTIGIKDGDIGYFSIHLRKSTNDFHIHYVVTCNTDKKDTIPHHIQDFNSSLSESCFYYFNNPGDNQNLIDFGFLLGVKNHNRFERIRLN
jgi:hypothetical protein